MEHAVTRRQTRSRASVSAQPRIPELMPLIPGGGTVMYPQQLLPLLATDQLDIKAVGEAAASEAKMVGVFPQHVLDEDRYEGDLYQLGTAATIVRMATAPDGTVHAILQGVGRIKLLGVEQAEPWIVGRIERLGETVDRSAGLDTLMGEIREGFVRIITLSATLPQELAAAVGNL